MAFKQAPSNPFKFLPDGTLSVRSNPPVLSPMGVPTAHTAHPGMQQLGPGVPTGYPGKCLKVIDENETGRNLRFLNMITGQELSLIETVGEIKSGRLPGHEICMINGIETPRSKADGSEANNLG